MKKEEIIERVKKAFLDEFDVEDDDLVPYAKLGEDLDLDSLDGIDLVVAIEREFKDNKVKIDEGAVKKLQTLDDIYNYVETCLSK